MLLNNRILPFRDRAWTGRKLNETLWVMYEDEGKTSQEKVETYERYLSFCKLDSLDFYYSETEPNNNRIFVFGSNEGGRHGMGAAKYARINFGAILGQGVGLQGNSYAIPTKDYNLRSLPLSKISIYITKFLEFSNNKDLEFDVTRIGCGLAGYKDKDIIPLFRSYSIPNNINLPYGW